MADKYLLSPAQLAAEQKSNPDLKIIDTGLPEPYQKRHIPGAVNISDFYLFMLKDSKDETLKEMQQHFSKLLGKADVSRRDRIVVYEESLDIRNGAAPRALFLLTYLGADNVAVLNGGSDAWVAEGLPTEEGHGPPIRETKFEPNVCDSVLVTRSEMEKAVARKDAVILDDRDLEEWIGEYSAPHVVGTDFCPRKGRIPGAIWILWRLLMNMEENGLIRYKPAQEIAQICSSKGLIDKQKPIFIYCFVGMRASNTWLALKIAGYSDVRNYFGSWNEWSRDPTLPIDSTLLEAK